MPADRHKVSLGAVQFEPDLPTSVWVEVCFPDYERSSLDPMNPPCVGNGVFQRVIDAIRQRVTFLRLKPRRPTLESFRG